MKPHKASNGPSHAVTISGLWLGSLYKSGREANNCSACACQTDKRHETKRNEREKRNQTNSRALSTWLREIKWPFSKKKNNKRFIVYYTLFGWAWIDRALATDKALNKKGRPGPNTCFSFWPSESLLLCKKLSSGSFVAEIREGPDGWVTIHSSA